VDDKDTEFLLEGDTKDWTLLDPRLPANGTFKGVPLRALRKENAWRVFRR